MLKRAKAAWEYVVDSRFDRRRKVLSAAGRATNRPAIELIQPKLPATSANLEIGLEIAIRAAQHQTGATGAALALVQGESLVCRARAGNIVPAVGVLMDAGSGITGACVRTGEVLYCADAETDTRVDRRLCRELNIQSILVVPIFKHQVVTGIVEVLSVQANAFDASHIRWLTEVAHFVEGSPHRPGSSSPQVLPSVPTEMVPQTIDHEAESGQPENSAFGVASQEKDREATEIAAIREVLEQSVGIATWDDLGRQLSLAVQEGGESEPSDHKQGRPVAARSQLVRESAATSAVPRWLAVSIVRRHVELGGPPLSSSVATRAKIPS